MNNTYTSLVNQTFHFPQEGFAKNENGYLEFNGLDLKAIIEKMMVTQGRVKKNRWFQLG